MHHTLTLHHAIDDVTTGVGTLHGRLRAWTEVVQDGDAAVLALRPLHHLALYD